MIPFKDLVKDGCFPGVPPENMSMIMVTKKEILRSLFVGMWLRLDESF
jgi:hypothetical protein